ncbi:MAG: hypothetical protein M3081_07395, partial [Gemmatimonadota bacterium]|nr:hypothetical protein [Gemmatimonadota bacterium]
QAYQKAVAILMKADSLATSANTKFLLGVSAFQVGDASVRENQGAKQCDLAKLAQDSFVTAQTNLPAGASGGDANTKQIAGQLLGAIGQYSAAVDGQVKKFCK